ncbi:hypothetical protein M911_03410 [Ectothiorhodospira haloalkaliphila]|uniref:Uncharacterized protein n=1 Tax=Ectothiorhodospira haloalkaliphila TaxID=421628 RepID=W8KMY9_9GAMM|nr:hypothetical protein M911_03410 [Ectothiorhodospira haloalkaliphila]
MWVFVPTGCNKRSGLVFCSFRPIGLLSPDEAFRHVFCIVSRSRRRRSGRHRSCGQPAYRLCRPHPRGRRARSGSVSQS